MPDAPRRTAGAHALWALAVPLSIAAVTGLGLRFGANSATAGFAYLVTVLLVASRAGWLAGAAASVLGFFAYNYYFLPPFGTFAVAAPANWVSLLSFLAASVLAGRLLAAARREAAEAERQRRELEILYELCFGLFATSRPVADLEDSATLTLRAVGATGGELILADAGGGVTSLPTDLSAESRHLDEAGGPLEEAIRSRRLVQRSPIGTPSTSYIPLALGGKVNGVLVARETKASPGVLESAGRLMALTIERRRLLAEAAELEAARRSDSLRTSLLRAVSHDLRTPLTAIRLETESLERQLGGNTEALASLAVLGRESERLLRRIDNLLSLARLEAGLARPHPEPVLPSSLFRAARESLASVLAGRVVEIRVESGCPDLWTDPALALEIVVNLLENAARADTSGGAIELRAGPAGGPTVRLEVLDRGPGLPPGVRDFLATSPRLEGGGGSGSVDSGSGGLGLRIARSLAEANGGTLHFAPREGGGTAARLDLPAAAEGMP